MSFWCRPGHSNAEYDKRAHLYSWARRKIRNRYYLEAPTGLRRKGTPVALRVRASADTLRGCQPEAVADPAKAPHDWLTEEARQERKSRGWCISQLDTELVLASAAW
eukprot:scaffold191869_cov29-Tisochrysis_lutea.AAC.7